MASVILLDVVFIYKLVIKIKCFLLSQTALKQTRSSNTRQWVQAVKEQLAAQNKIYCLIIPNERIKYWIKDIKEWRYIGECSQTDATTHISDILETGLCNYVNIQSVMCLRVC